jgi:dynein heavy chain 1, cytosolic
MNQPKIKDLPLLSSLLSDVFPGTSYIRAELSELKEHIKCVCEQMSLVYDEDTSKCGGVWLEKVIQLYQITNLNHGLMMVGPTGSGKSCAWRVLLKALNKMENSDGVAHVIDPKAITKDELYGCMDANTREWKDGLFTQLLRRIIDNLRGEQSKRQWIVFDGDVDPEWVENLNSVLDDNKLLTLPNGERLALPPNLRILFEVQDLRHATLATVSRCGMIWFSEDTVTTGMLYKMYLNRLRTTALLIGDDAPSPQVQVTQSQLVKTNESIGHEEAAGSGGAALSAQKHIASILEEHLSDDGVVGKALAFAARQEHIMDFLSARCLNALFSMLNQTIKSVMQRTREQAGLSPRQLEAYILKSLLVCVVWSFSGDSKLPARKELSDYVCSAVKSGSGLDLPSNDSCSLIDYEVSSTGEWLAWSGSVPVVDLDDSSKIAASDVIIPTVDTVRHEWLLYTWLAEHRPLLLCGPPGSGKTMSLFAALRSLPHMDVVGLNFSSATTPELMLQTFAHYCEYKRTHDGVVLAPAQLNKWLVVFCDEINLPDEDKYGTQRVISFLRECVELNGFYRSSDHTWVKLERIQFVGACNPPTDPGRKPLSQRFMRHVPLVYVDYPGERSLKQIYGTFNRAMLKRFANIRQHADLLTSSMVEFFLQTQVTFSLIVCGLPFFNLYDLIF